MPVIDNQERLEFLGVSVDCVTMDGALNLIQSRVRTASKPAYIVCANPEKVYTLKSNPSLRQFFASADLIIPDGIGVVLAARLLSGQKLNRLPGADLMQAICAVAPGCGYRIFLYGGSPEVNRRAAHILTSRYPGMRIVGREHGYVPANEQGTLIEQINEAHADILFVALGSPRQELWIQRNLGNLNVKVVHGIGGTLDIIAGTIRRAPRWMQASGLEWLYRLLRQPWRAYRHRNLVRFMIDVIALKVNGNSRRLPRLACSDRPVAVDSISVSRSGLKTCIGQKDAGRPSKPLPDGRKKKVRK